MAAAFHSSGRSSSSSAFSNDLPNFMSCIDPDYHALLTVYHPSMSCSIVNFLADKRVRSDWIA